MPYANSEGPNQLAQSTSQICAFTLISSAVTIDSVFIAKDVLFSFFSMSTCMAYGPIYSRTSVARTSLGPWKFVRDMGSSGH